MTQVTINSKGSTSPGRSRRGKPRYRKAGKGSTGDLAQLKATLSSSLAMVNSTASVPSSKQRLDPSAAIRDLQHDLLLKKMYSSSPDLISTTVEAEGRRKALVSPGLDRVGSLSASTGLADSRRTAGTGDGPNEEEEEGTGDLAEMPPRSDTPSEDAASIPFSSSPDSPCGRGAAVGRASVLGNSRLSHEGEEKEEGTVITRSPRSQRLTPAALLYRAAVTRSQVRLKHAHAGKSDCFSVAGHLLFLRKTQNLKVCVLTFHLQRRGVSSEEEEGEVDSEVELPRRR